MPLLSVKDMEHMSRLFRGRLGNAIAGGLIHILSIDRVNKLYDSNIDMKGPDFAAAVLNDVGFEYQIGVADDPSLRLADILPSGPFITISNHPCGHLDGVSLVDIFGHIRPDYKVMVNRILARVKPLEGNFIEVTPVGNERKTPTAASISGVKEALRHLRDGGSLGLFPSGAVSDLSLKERCIRDRQWQEAVIRLIMKAEVPVVPVRFFDGNSAFYYSLGLIDWRVRLLRLPAEVFNKRGKTMHIGVGRPISVRQQKQYGKDVEAFRDFLRNSVYGMTCIGKEKYFG